MNQTIDAENDQTSAMETGHAGVVKKVIDSAVSHSGVDVVEISLHADGGNEEEEAKQQQPLSDFNNEQHQYEVSSDGDHSEEEETDEDSDSESDSSDDEIDIVDDVEPDEQLDAQLLGVDKALIPIRAKYCRNSRRVVATFDHYCAVLGTCIGEKNHFRFFVFLLLNTVTIAYGISFVHSGFRDTTAEVGTWLSYNSHALGAALVLWILLFTIGGLFCFHWFLGMANITSYEFMRAEKISYLKNTRDFDLPFSNGFRFNMRIFVLQDAAVHAVVSRLCCAGGAGREWKRWMWSPVGEIKRDEEDWASNMWENKYWSCC
jgi:hypothetical protein